MISAQGPLHIGHWVARQNVLYIVCFAYSLSLSIVVVVVFPLLPY